MKRLKSTVFLLFIILQISAFDINLVSFNKLPFKNELPGSIVRRIFQDNRGFIWIGTESGICRYDGYKVITIKSDSDRPDLLTSGNILCISQDNENRIWFGTDRGVNIIDENNQLVSLFPNHKMQDLRINSILCDSKGKVWIGSEKGLYLYYPQTKEIKSYFHSSDPTSIPGNNINQIFEDKSGNIWVALWRNGLCKFNTKFETFTAMPTFGANNNPYYVCQDKEGLFWIGTWGDGLFRVSFENDTPDYSQFIPNRDANNLPDISIYSILEDDKTGSLWILSQLGLSIIEDTKNVKFSRINAMEIFSNASNALNQITKDRQGNIWIASSNDGVYMAKLNKPFIFSNNLDFLKRKYGYITIDAIIEDGDNILLGLANFGLHAINKETQQPDKKTNLLKLIQSIYKKDISTVYCFERNNKDGSIWIGGGGFLARIIKKNNTYHLEDILTGKKNLDIDQRGTISALMCDKKNRMWIATRYGVYLENNGNAVQISRNFNSARSICQGNGNQFWIGSPTLGLIQITENSNIFTQRSYTTLNKKLNSNEINIVYKDTSGEIWVGTNNGGLSKYNVAKDVFEPQNKIYSILEHDIKNIIEDNYGHLWLSSNNKIIKINKSKLSSTLFTDNDYLLVNSFKTGSAFKDSEGKLYFGGGNGYCTFSPKLEKEKINIYSTQITDIQVFNQSIFENFNPKMYDEKTKTLFLNYKQRNVGFEFSSINFSSPENINYAYKLVGVDNDWVNVDSKRRYVNYSNLSNGKYIFEVKSTDENGVWNENSTKLFLVVNPAPYETWWAFLIYLILLSFLIIVVYRTIRNRILLKRDLLISRIERKNSEALTHIKLKYFTNISHELLTPLSIISLIIEQFQTDFPDRLKHYSIMKSNISRLKRLLQQILDFRKVESGNMKLSVKKSDITEFINNICWNYFDPLAKEKKINFTITAPEKLIVWFDHDKIDKIIFNLLSNAFKYTAFEGTIDVTILTADKNGVLNVIIFISDTGSGISPEKIPYIFDRFYGNESDEKSNGIGLSLTKDLIEIHKGKIFVESQLNKGTTFKIEFPADEKVFSHVDRELETSEQILSPLPIFEKITESENVQFKDKLILVVEDNVDLLMILSNSLSANFKIITAQNGLFALKLLKEYDIDMVVSDVMMPEMDGISLCKTIKSDIELSHIPVLLLTAKNQIVDRIDCYNAGADAYISKPFEMEVLEARTRNLINNKINKQKEFKSTLEIHAEDYENYSIDDIFLKDAISIVEKNMTDFAFTHEQLGDAMNTSKSTLYRKLKSLTGLAPSEFVRNIRLKHACEMMKHENGNISEIAYKVGYEPKYFSTCFKAEYGISPREYIKNIK